MVWSHIFEGFSPWLAGSVAYRSVTEYHGGGAQESSLLLSSKVTEIQVWGRDMSIRVIPSDLPTSVSHPVIVHSAMSLFWVSPH